MIDELPPGAKGTTSRIGLVGYCACAARLAAARSAAASARMLRSTGGGLGGSEQVPENERQDPAVLVVVDLDRRVDAQQQLDLLRAAVLAADHRRELLARLHAFLDAEDVHRLVAPYSPP